MDYDALEIMVEQLKGYKLPEDFIFKLKDIEKAMKSFDWDKLDGIMETIE